MYYNRHAHKVLSLLGEVLAELEALRDATTGYSTDIENVTKLRDALGSKFLDNDLL